MQETKRSKLERKLWRELGFCLYYFAVSFLCTSVAYTVLDRSLKSGNPSDDAVHVTEDYTVAGMFRMIWYHYYRGWFYTFLGLSALRFMIIFLAVPIIRKLANRMSRMT